MVIFNSYVKLPEGSILEWILNMEQTCVHPSGGYPGWETEFVAHQMDIDQA